MTGKNNPAARVERMFRIAMVPALIFLVVSTYVRVTSRPDPFWSELAMPLFFALLGARSIALPQPPDKKKAARTLGIVLIACAALILFLNLLDYFQGAN
jgi:hypothetical protein